MKLTASQYETLRRVLKHGGNVGVTQGSLKTRKDYINKIQATRMIELGLLECRHYTEPRGPLKVTGWYAGTYRPDGGIYATAAGCRAYNEYEARLSA